MNESQHTVRRLERLLGLIQEIRQGPVTLQYLSEQFGIGIRMLFRDIKLLRELGWDVLATGSGQYTLAPGSCCICAEPISAEDLSDLQILIEYLASRRQIPNFECAARGMAKLRQTLSRRQQEQIDQLTQSVTVDLGPAVRCSSSVFRKLRRAQAERRWTHISYCPAGGISKFYQLAVHQLCYLENAWYALGILRERQGVHLLRLKRIESVDLLQTFFHQLSTETGTDYLGKAWRVAPEGQLYHIAILLTGPAADTAEESTWHPTQCVERLNEGTVRAEFLVDGLSEITRWILSLGPHCTVESPRLLRDRVAKTAASIQRRHS